MLGIHAGICKKAAHGWRVFCQGEQKAQKNQLRVTFAPPRLAQCSTMRVAGMEKGERGRGAAGGAADRQISPSITTLAGWWSTGRKTGR